MLFFFPRIAWNHWTNKMHGVITCHNHHIQCAKGMKENIAKHGKGLQVATTPSCRYEQYRKIKVNSPKTEDGTQTLVSFVVMFFSFPRSPSVPFFCFRECHVRISSHAWILNFIIFTVSEVWKSSSKGRPRWQYPKQVFICRSVICEVVK